MSGVPVSAPSSRRCRCPVPGASAVRPWRRSLSSPARTPRWPRAGYRKVRARSLRTSDRARCSGADTPRGRHTRHSIHPRAAPRFRACAVSPRPPIQIGNRRPTGLGRQDASSTWKCLPEKVVRSWVSIRWITSAASSSMSRRVPMSGTDSRTRRLPRHAIRLRFPIRSARRRCGRALSPPSPAAPGAVTDVNTRQPMRAGWFPPPGHPGWRALRSEARRRLQRRFVEMVPQGNPVHAMRVELAPQGSQFRHRILCWPRCTPSEIAIGGRSPRFQRGGRSIQVRSGRSGSARKARPTGVRA